MFLRIYFSRWLTLLLLLAAGGSVSSAWAQTSERCGLCFEIRQFEVQGNTILTEDRLDAILAPYKGTEKDFGSVQQALEALENAYAALGFNAIQVILPEQTLESGVVRFMVMESRLAMIKVEGNRHFSTENVQRSLVSLAAGTTPNFDAMVDNLRLINENPAKQISVVMRAGLREGEVDAVANVTDKPPIRYAVTFDNTGNAQTGPFRIGVAVQHANLFDRDHVLSFQAITSPFHARQVRIYGLGYQAPVYAWNGIFGAFLGYSNVNSGTIFTAAGDFNIAGSGVIVGMRYTQHLPKRGNWDHRLSFGMDWKAYQNNVTVVGSERTLVPDSTVSPASLTWQFSRRDSSSDLSGYFSLVLNLPNLFGGNDAHDSQIQQMGLRPGANSDFQIWRYGLDLQEALAGDWMLRAGLSGQHARQMLLTSEMFGIGGANSVRGFLEREHANDHGHRASLEVYGPEMGSRIVNNLKLRALGFYDIGWVKRIHPTPQEIYSTGISSAGIGLRASVGNDLSLRLDYAKVLDGSHTSRGMRLHGSVSYIF